MAKTTANGIQIEYETFGRPAEAPLLLIVGLAWQLIHWDEALCEELARRGHYVIRFDNRDTGLSTKLEEGGIPDIGQIRRIGLQRPHLTVTTVQHKKGN